MNKDIFKILLFILAGLTNCFAGEITDSESDEVSECDTESDKDVAKERVVACDAGAASRPSTELSHSVAICAVDGELGLGRRKRHGDRVKEWPFKCSDCGKIFDYRRRLDRHMRSHRGERPFKCPHCASTFFQSTHMDEHIMRKHTSDRPYKCDYHGCDKAFVTKSECKNHKKIHTEKEGEYPDYARVFVPKTDLTRQMLTHVGEKSYKCEYPDCGMLFVKKLDLTKHEKEHPHTCKHPGCGVVFPRQSDLIKHIVAEHYKAVDPIVKDAHSA